MAKHGPMDSFLSRKRPHSGNRQECLNIEQHDDSESDDSCSRKISQVSVCIKSKQVRTSFIRKYDESYILFGFIPNSENQNFEKPQCVICGEILSNEALKPSKLIRHLQTKHKELSSKPKEFFERKRDELKVCQKQMHLLSHTNVAALRASYKVAFRIAKAKKPYIIGEQLLIGCIKDVCQEMLGECAATKVSRVPLSNDTIARRISDIANDMEEQLIHQIKLTNWFSLQLDESTDIANLAILLVYIRFEHDGDLKEEYLCSISLPTNTTSAEVFKALNGYIVDQSGLSWRYCIGICTDGAAAMTGRHSGVVARIKAVAPECKSTHCCIHRESLATKKISVELNNILNEIVKIVNYVKANALNSRIFASLCDDMGADHKQLLLHAEVRWLSRGKVLSRVFELRNELAVFMQHRKPDWSQMCHDANWVAKLAYLSDIFSVFNELNSSMQGKMSSVFATADKIDGIKRRLEAWKARVLRDSCYDMFPNLISAIDDKREEIDADSLKNLIVEHLSSLTERFELYFPKEQDPRKGTGWIRNPFMPLKDDLDVSLEDKLLQLASGEGFKMIFETVSLAGFWIKARTEYPELSVIALKTILPFPSTYLCETGFSTMSIIKTKHRNNLDICSPFRVALSSIVPRLDKLVNKKQAHCSH